MKSKSFKISHTFCEIEKLVDVAQPKFVGTLNCPVKCRWVVEQSSWRWSSASHSRTSWRKCRGWGSQKSESRCKLEHDFVWILKLNYCLWLWAIDCFHLSRFGWFVANSCCLIYTNQPKSNVDQNTVAGSRCSHNLTLVLPTYLLHRSTSAFCFALSSFLYLSGELLSWPSIIFKSLMTLALIEHPVLTST